MDAGGEPRRPAAPWALDADGALAELGSGPRGIAAAEAERRLQRFGPNELPEERPTGAATIAIRQFRSPLIYILLIAGLVTVALAEYLDAAVIAVVLVMNAVVGFFQEFRAERSMAALRKLASARATVLREGREIEIDVAAVVPGDVIAVEAGSRVPADCRLVSGAGLEVDESHLTGESETVAKAVAALPAETPTAERSNMLFTGSAVTLGRGTGVVVATGGDTELGAISASLGEIGLVETPLQARISRLARTIGLAVSRSASSASASGRSPARTSANCSSPSSRWRSRRSPRRWRSSSPWRWRSACGGWRGGGRSSAGCRRWRRWGAAP